MFLSLGGVASLGRQPVVRLAKLTVVTEVFKNLMQLESVSDNYYVAPASPEKGERTFGGQLLAHTLRAAQISVDSGKSVHSSHSYFLQPGRVDAPTDLFVETVRDGRSFSVRQVTACQSGVELFRSLISFQIREKGLDWAPDFPREVPEPNKQIRSYYEFWEAESPQLQGPWHGRDRPIDILYINPPDQPQGLPITEPQLMWIRVNERLQGDRGLNEAALAYIADATLIDHVLLPHGFRWQDGRLTGASLDHSMWIHCDVDADDWLLYEQSVETTRGGRGLARGRFFDRRGLLVATCMQEGLIRWDFRQ